MARKKASKRKATRKAPARKKATKQPKAKATKAPAATRPKSVPFKTRKNGVFTHADLADHIGAWNPGLTRGQAKQVVEDTLSTLAAAIKKTGRVRLKGIGTITTKKIPARKGGKMVRNPFTGEMVPQKPKPASVKVKLSAAKDLKKA